MQNEYPKWVRWLQLPPLVCQGAHWSTSLSTVELLLGLGGCDLISWEREHLFFTSSLQNICGCSAHCFLFVFQQEGSPACKCAFFLTVLQLVLPLSLVLFPPECEADPRTAAELILSLARALPFPLKNWFYNCNHNYALCFLLKSSKFHPFELLSICVCLCCLLFVWAACLVGLFVCPGCLSLSPLLQSQQLHQRVHFWQQGGQAFSPGISTILSPLLVRTSFRNQVVGSGKVAQ